MLSLRSFNFKFFRSSLASPGAAHPTRIRARIEAKCESKPQLGALWLLRDLTRGAEIQPEFAPARDGATSAARSHPIPSIVWIAPCPRSSRCTGRSMCHECSVQAAFVAPGKVRQVRQTATIFAVFSNILNDARSLHFLYLQATIKNGRHPE